MDNELLAGLATHFGTTEASMDGMWVDFQKDYPEDAHLFVHRFSRRTYPANFIGFIAFVRDAKHYREHLDEEWERGRLERERADRQEREAAQAVDRLMKRLFFRRRGEK